MIEYFIRINTNNDIEILDYDEDRDGELFLWLHFQIGCNSIETVSLFRARGTLLIVDKCGYMRDPTPDINILASELYSGGAFAIVGDAIWCAQGYRHGEPDAVGFLMTDALRRVSKLKRLRKELI